MDFLKYIRENAMEQVDDKIISEEGLNEEVLLQELETFFPEDGSWTSGCFNKSKEVLDKNLPCNLRDNKWLSELLWQKLVSKGFTYDQTSIEKYINKSVLFNKLRHDYELRIVKWQIEFIMNRGEGWLLPDEYDEFSLLFSSELDEIVRGGVIKTLTAIGMDEEVVEEGLEVYAGLWRESCFQQSFNNEFEPPIFFGNENVEPADEEHRKNWIRMKRYNYFQRHESSMKQYGRVHSDMLMPIGEALRTNMKLIKQNEERKKYISKFREVSAYDLEQKPEEDIMGNN